MNTKTNAAMMPTRTWVLGALSLALLLIRADSVRAQGFTMYGAEFQFDGRFYEVNAANGSLRTISLKTGAFYAGMDFDPATGTLWACSGSFLYTVNPATGRPLTTRQLTGSSDVFNLSVGPNGTLYGLGNGNGNLYQINTATAAAILIGSSGYGMFGLEFGPGGVLYGCGYDLFQIDVNTGAATDLGRLVPGIGALFSDLDLGPDGVMYGVTDQITSDSLYSIDLVTHTATLIGVTGGDLVSIASIPEPSSFGLLALGWLGLLRCAKIRRRKRG